MAVAAGVFGVPVFLFDRYGKREKGASWGDLPPNSTNRTIAPAC
jgi:hypothetical protein